MIHDVIAVLNRMVSDGIIKRYAIGGAVGATVYLEPMATLDVDVFVDLSPADGLTVISLEPIYRYLSRLGHLPDREFVTIGDWPVQFLPPTGPLVDEAMDEAASVDVGGVPARVFDAEHLAAIALETGRAKDKARVLMFLESGILDMDRFQDIVQRHVLNDAWTQFQHQFGLSF